MMNIVNQSELTRLEELKSFAILDTPPEAEFDRITRLAANICGTPISIISLIDEERQWFKSIVGLDICETDRSVAFCAHAIHSEQPFIVTNALEDIRFADNPLVTGTPHIRFYAGVPLITSKGHALGTLCIMDRKPRILTESQLDGLKTLASQVVVQLELRRQAITLENLMMERDWINATLFQQTKLLQEAQRIAEVGSWDLLIEDNRLIWSDEVYRIFGLEKQQCAESFESFLMTVHPEDRPALIAAQQAALQQNVSLDHVHRIVRPDGEIRFVQERGQLVINEQDGKKHFIGTVQDVTRKKLVEEQLSALANRLTSTLESITDAFYTLDLQWRFTYLNKEAERVLHRNRAELLGKVIWDEYEDIVGRTFHREYQRAMEQNCTAEFEEYYPPLQKWLEVRAYPSTEGLAVYIRDVTERKQTEIELARLNRALRLLGTINESMIHLSDEQQLLEQICRLAVEVGGYKAAWVGYAHDDAYKTVEPRAFFGNEEFAQFISNLKVSWNEHHALGNGPSGRVIRSGNALVIEDISKDPQYSPWLAAVQSTGHHGVITLPLKDKHEATFGQLSLYSGEVRQVAEAELKLLGEMADDLAFGIKSIRSQQDRSRIQAAVMKVAASVSASTGTVFFEQLVRNMVDAMGADAGFVARLMPGEHATAQTLVAIIDGEIRTNFTYSLEGTPCENLTQADDCVVPSGVNRSYPFAQILSEIKAEAYVGGRLTSSSGQTIGLLFVLFRAPLKNTDFIKSTLQIFAARAAAELERQEADIRLREQASLLDKAQDAIIVLGTDNKIQLWSKGAERLYGWTAEEALGTSLDMVLHEDPAPFLEAIRCVMEKGEWNGEIMQRRKDHSTLIVEGRWTLVRKENNEPQSILAINTDITQRRAAADEIQHLAFYDVLTGLPNRQLLRDRLKHVLTTTPRSQQSGALLFIDLDNFKTLNDTLGHDKGDLLLQEVAKRLMTCVRKSDTVARLGGDEFVVLLENLSDNLAEAASQSKLVGEKILSSFNEPYELANYPYHSTPSIGITLFDPQHINADELLKRADIAMYQAKAAGKNSLRFFDPEMQAVVNAKVELEADLRQGFQQHEFHLHYQPQIDHNGDVTGAEALLRWQHPQRGFVSPAAFIPVAEETGLIIQLGKLVLETACKQLAAWALRPETSRLSIAVNVSARQFRNADFVEQVVAVLQETGAHPQRLKLELTESLLLDNLEETIKKMSALKAHGVCFALDDFGTGYSSLSYLKRLPLDQLKIDQSFVRDVLDDPNDTVIVRTIIALGQNLGLEVIAEGVETLEQRNFLTLHGCEAYQGYYFSRPLAIDVFEEFILKN